MTFGLNYSSFGASLVAQGLVMQEPQEMWVQSLGQEDPLEEGTAPTLAFLPGKSENPVGRGA